MPRCYFLQTAIRPFHTPVFKILNAFLHRKEFPTCSRAVFLAVGNVAGEGEELRNILLSQGALPSLARMMLRNKGSTVRTAAWALSNLIKVLTPFNFLTHSKICICCTFGFQHAVCLDSIQ